MNVEQQRRAESIFRSALDHDDAAREGFVDEACGEDGELRREVLGLLRHFDRADGFLSPPRLEPRDSSDAGRLDAPADSRSPTITAIGGYRVLGVLGRGGMGIVYRAEQERPKRLVALKVMQPGLATPTMLRRFELETEVLGRLSHPGIARIYEAGTADVGAGSQPFFAMELVDGQPLTHYAAERDLGTRARLDLLARVCDAVQHAHQQGVIHRDLKPGNVLVDRDGQPRVLDFGVARATNADVQLTTLRTDVGQLIGTVPYMSPEQVAGDPAGLDTRSDVYALGVLGYELLAGRLPYDLSHAALPEAARVIREQTPTPLSSVNRVFHGDVETIFGRALEKERERRYQSASELAADVRHYLADEPIVARRPSAAYQFRKFARRNKLLVGNAAALAVILVAATIGMSLLALRATQQRDRALAAEQHASQLARSEEDARREAEREAASATAVSGFLQEMLNTASPTVSRGREVTVREVLDDARAHIDKTFADEPEIAAALHHVIGTALDRLGYPCDAEEHLRAALRLRRALFGNDHPRTLESMTALANVLSDQGRFDESLELTRAVVDSGSLAEGGQPGDELVARHNLASLLRRRGQLDKAETLLRSTIDAMNETLGPDHAHTLNAMNTLGIVLWDRGRYEECEQALRQVLEGRRRTLGDDHPSTISTVNSLGSVLSELGRTAEAETLLREAVETNRRVLGAEHTDTLLALNNLAHVLGQLGRYDESIEIHRSALDIQQRALGPDHPDTLLALANLGSALLLDGRLDDAEPLLRDALDRHRRVFGLSHPGTLAVLGHLGKLARERGELAEAERLYREVMDLRRETLGPRHPATLVTAYNVATTLDHQGKNAEAAELLAEAVAAIPEAFPEGHRQAAIIRSLYGATLTRLGRYEEAEPQLLQAHGDLAAADDDPGGWTRTTVQRLVKLYELSGDMESAEAWRQRIEAPAE